MRDAEQEKRLADGEYQKQSQYFESNHKLREALETRRSKCDRAFETAWSDYTKAAQIAEPILRRIAEPAPPINDAVIEDVARKVTKRQLNDFPTFREMGDAMEKLERKTSKPPLADIRTEVRREMRDYTHSSDFKRLSDQVRDLSLRGRQPSLSSDTPRDMDPRLGAQARDVENLKQEFSSRQQEQGREIASLNERLNTLNTQQREIMEQQNRQAQMAPVTRSEDIVKVY